MKTDNKAFIIKSRYGDGDIILFDKHRATAQREGASELRLDFQEVSCKRVKQYDKFYPKVPISQLIMDDWWRLLLLFYKKFI